SFQHLHQFGDFCNEFAECLRQAFMVSRENSSPSPHGGVSIDSAVSVLKFQTIQEAENQFSTMNEEDFFSKGQASLNTHKMCLQCFAIIDPSTCRSFDEGWSIGWYCGGVCGGYVKKSKEMITSYLKGADRLHKLDKSEIHHYLLKQFSWVEDTSQETGVNQFYAELACAIQREGATLRQTLGDADFFGYTNIFDTLARSWCDEQQRQFIAIRLQGVILLRYDKIRLNYRRNRNEVKESKKTNTPATIKLGTRDVMHFQLVKSVLQAATGRSQTICVLVEHSLDQNAVPIGYGRPQVKRSYSHQIFEKNFLAWLVRMKLTGVHRIHNTYKDDETDKWTFERLREIMDCQPEMEQRTWDNLAQILARIQECLPNDGEYCSIQVNAKGPNGPLTMQNKGAIDLNYLREDFRGSFNL
ncbi:hypothetical protein PRIPAC_76447, partial [Pristionchus pacificus]